LHNLCHHPIAESTPRKPKFEIDDEEDDDGLEEEISDFGELASPYLKPYIYNATFK
jgi:hypothetical protein